VTTRAWSRWLVGIPVGALLLAALVLVGRVSRPTVALATPPEPSPRVRTLTLTGRGTVQVAPDVAWVRVGVQTQADQAQDAVSQNNRIVERVRQAVLDAGVAAPLCPATGGRAGPGRSPPPPLLRRRA